MGALFSLGAGCQKWKPLDIPGTQPPLSDAVVNRAKKIFEEREGDFQISFDKEAVDNWYPVLLSEGLHVCFQWYC